MVGPDEGLAGPGDIVVKLQAAETGGRWGVAVVSGVPGEGGRTHVHRGEPEGFFVLEGEVELLGVSSRTPIGPGTFVLVPPDTEHGLRIVGTGEARWLAIWPAALDGLVEELLMLDPDDAAGAVDARRRHGMEPGRDRRDQSEDSPPVSSVRISQSPEQASVADWLSERANGTDFRSEGPAGGQIRVVARGNDADGSRGGPNGPESGPG